MKRFEVRDTLLIIPQTDREGKRLGINRGVKEGEILTEIELGGVNIDRLISIGSVVELEDEVPVEVESTAIETPAESKAYQSPELSELTLGQLKDLARSLGIYPLPQGKESLISAIRQIDQKAVAESK